MTVVTNYAGFPAQHFRADYDQLNYQETSYFDQGPKQNTGIANVSLWMSLLVLIILHTLCSEATRYVFSCCDRALKLKTKTASRPPVYNQFVCCSN